MPTPTKGPRLGGSPAHERLMLANLATSLFQHGKIQTTETKAKRLRPLAEQLITKAKRGDLHARRRVLTVVRDKDVVYALFDEIAPRYANRAGGYTRIVKTGPRKGDAAPMAIIELVEELVEVAAAGQGTAKKAARKAAQQDKVAALAGEADEEPTAVEAARPTTGRRAAEDASGDNGADGPAPGRGRRRPSRSPRSHRSGAVRPAAWAAPRSCGASSGGRSRAASRVRLDVSYDGTDFSGWAAQPGRRTVAGVLDRGAGAARSARTAPPG